MKAIVTGASSGIGYEISKYLSSKGYEIIAVARDKQKLDNLVKECETKVDIYLYDLSIKENIYELYNKIKDEPIDILVNNAGFGAFGNFDEIDIDKQINMIDINVKAVEILTYLFLKKMKENNRGYILNIGSVAGFLPGPLMATYYATKAYVLRLTQGIRKELRKSKSHISINVCCPGPVETNFNNVANVRFGVKPKTSKYVAKDAIDKMFKNRGVICPGFTEKFIRFGSKIAPDNVLSEITYHMQCKKR